MSTTPETTQEPESELGRLIQPVQPYIEKYGSKVVLGLAALLLIAATYIFYQRSANAAAAAGWGDLASANQPEDFADVADQFAGSPAAAWARLAAANGYFSNGVRMSFTSRTAAKGSFDKAQSAFKKLLDNRGTPKPVRERALFGMAKLEEAMSGQDTSSAIAAYEKLLSDFPSTTYKEIAEKRIEALKNPEVQEFYGWFREQDPSVAEDLLTPDDGSLIPKSPREEKTGVPSFGDSLLDPNAAAGDGSSTDTADEEKASAPDRSAIPPVPGSPEAGSSPPPEKPNPEGSTEGASGESGSEDK